MNEVFVLGQTQTDQISSDNQRQEFGQCRVVLGGERSLNIKSTFYLAAELPLFRTMRHGLFLGVSSLKHLLSYL